MADNIWQQGRIQEIVYTAGKDSNGNTRYVKASYEILHWGSTSGGIVEDYVIPKGFFADPVAGLNIAGFQDEQAKSEFGYYTPDRIVIEPHEADGKSDSWKALHSFGPI